MLVFSGTSYLGLDHHPQFRAAVQRGMEQYGTHYGGSRRSPLVPGVYAEAEAAMAAWAGAPAALLVGSGTSAGQLVASYLASRGHTLQLSPFAHPASWWPGAEAHHEWATWLAAAREHDQVCLTDGINPLRIALPPWDALPANGSATLVVDDAHLLGCWGAAGAGSWPMLRGRWAGELMVTASLGKALAMPGGVILGSQALVAALRELPQFGGASPPPPAYLYAWLHTQELREAQRTRLHHHLRYLQGLLAGDERVRMVPGFPVIGLLVPAWVDRLAEQGIVVSAFRYPGPTDPYYARIVVRADHTDEEIAFLGKCLRELTA
ncbi:MAG: hypothetical protein DA408_20090 [Bacteroidetes bacterium]|nr:MAG: hypothetical protein C7N36_10845 [Bacteroidota bacterium]PTM08666.1 MAG: hypothetical protein DA408_20090 [Bacteroidota bacterium]